jgi:hypothetical protein
MKTLDLNFTSPVNFILGGCLSIGLGTGLVFLVSHYESTSPAVDAAVAPRNALASGQVERDGFVNLPTISHRTAATSVSPFAQLRAIKPVADPVSTGIANNGSPMWPDASLTATSPRPLSSRVSSVERTAVSTESDRATASVPTRFQGGQRSKRNRASRGAQRTAGGTRVVSSGSDTAPGRDSDEESRGDRKSGVVTVASNGASGAGPDEAANYPFLDDPQFWALVESGDEDPLEDYLDSIGYGDLDAEEIIERHEDGLLQTPQEFAGDSFRSMWWTHAGMIAWSGGW